MTISAVVPDIAFAGSSGSGTMGPFSLVKNGTPLVFYANSEVVVLRYASVTDTTPTLLVEGTDYTLTGGPTGGLITLTSPQTGLLTAERLYVTTLSTLAQSLDLVTGGNFSAANIERRFDIIYQILQQHAREIKSSIRFAMFDTDEIPKTTPLAAVIDKIPYVTGTASAPEIAFYPIDQGVADISAVAGSLAEIEIVAADLTGADTIGTVAADLSGDNDIGTVADWLNGGGDEISLSAYPATQAGFVEAATAAITAGKWLNGEEIPITLTSLMTITLTGPLRWRNVRLSKLTKSAADFEYSLTVNGPDFANVTNLASNAAIGESSLSVASATNLVAGGKYLLISNASYNPDPAAYGNSVANKSEWVRVSMSYTSGTSPALMQALQSSYATADTARIYRFLETATVEFENVKFTGGGVGQAQGGARFNHCVIKKFDGQSDGNDYAAFTFNLCSFESYITGVIENSSLSGYGYGIEVVGCDAPLIDWVWGENVRHVVTRGSSFTTTLPFAGGSAVILGRGGATGSVVGLRSTGSVDDVHTGQVGHNIGEVAGDLVPGNLQEAVTVESHGISYGSIRVTGADLPVTVLYYGHPVDEPSPIVKFGSSDVGYGGTASNMAFLVINRDAVNRTAFHCHADVIEGRYPGGINATATEGPVYLSVDKASVYSRTTHTVSAVSSANGQVFVTIQNPWIIEDSGNASICAVRAEGAAYEAVNAGMFGAIIELGNGNVTADNTTYRADDAQIRLNGTRGTSTQSLAGIGTVLTPGQVKSNVLVQASATSLTTATAKTITSVSLEPGTWKISGQANYLPAATTSITRFISALSTTANALPSVSDVTNATNNMISAAYVPGTITINMTTGEAIVTLTATTTYYLIGHATFTVSTMTAFGKIQAERIS